MKTLLTAESVCKGHPDKLCDQISDAILDWALMKDRASRVAVEVMATRGHIIIAGEITCKEKLDIRWIVRDVLMKLGYETQKYKIHVYLHKQSEDIKTGVDYSLEQREKKTSIFSILGAGDQGTMYGYATNETSEKLPLPLVYAHKICKRFDKLREDGIIEGILSDGKSQVSIEYEDGKAKRVESVVLSIRHSEFKNVDILKEEIMSLVVLPIFTNIKIDDRTEILINPSGRFVEGGPDADTGLTGRKIMVDTYGGRPHGGGAFSGKDPTKVDRTAAYMARHIAKQIVSDEIAEECEVALSYAIGKAEPVAVNINTFRTGIVPDDILVEIIKDNYSLTPNGMIDYLDLKIPIYRDTACYGHFNSILFPWEQVKYGKLKKVVDSYGH
ncbi:methionine adenosyltransferase [Miniphocaeibacter massiliensis]|uniref:methionine adenosyltransferase n=1 Tax=Miniphocaeibacter massiliensis TaxID=2041841 RepID=UPI000C1BE134|nr:methionine adenosyltransferase [Miniphocaeibacter massiliensis]